MILSEYITAVQAMLGDSSAVRWNSSEITECIRNALGEYSRAWPQLKTASHTVTTSGRDQNINTSCAGVTTILEVIYPYVSTNIDHPYVDDWYLYWLSGAAWLHIQESLSSPVAGEKLYITFAATHTIDDLDSAATTTVRADHERMLVTGACAYAMEMRANAITESWGKRSKQDESIASAAVHRQRFNEWLTQLRSQFAPPRPITGWPERGWVLDQWDKEEDVHG
jgi:hypothetical protein